MSLLVLRLVHHRLDGVLGGGVVEVGALGHVDGVGALVLLLWAPLTGYGVRSTALRTPGCRGTGYGVRPVGGGEASEYGVRGMGYSGTAVEYRSTAYGVYDTGVLLIFSKALRAGSDTGYNG